MSFASWTYDFSTAIAPPPVATQVRINAAHPYTTATAVYVRNLTTTGLDVHIVLMAIPSGASLYIQDKNDHTLFGQFTTTGPPVDRIDYVEFPVTWAANGTALLQQEIQLLVVTAAVLPPEGPPGIALVTLEVARDHLRLEGTAEDTRITRLIEEASAYVLAYLADRGDPSWDAATVDPIVRSAVLLKLTDLHDNLGDDLSKAEAIRLAIINLLMPIRPPAMA